MDTHTHPAQITQEDAHPSREVPAETGARPTFRGRDGQKTEAQTKHTHTHRYTDKHTERRDAHKNQKYTETRTEGSTNSNTQIHTPGEGVHRHPRQQQTQRDPGVRIHPEMQSRRGGTLRGTHTEDTQKHNNTHKEIHPASPGHAPPEGHTHSGGGVCSVAGERGKCARSSRKPREHRSARPGPRQPGDTFSAHLSTRAPSCSRCSGRPAASCWVSALPPRG